MDERLVVRNATEKDIPALLVVDREAFPDDWPKELCLTPDYFEAWLETYAKGFFVAEFDGRAVGYASVEIIDHDLEHPIPTWYEATDLGKIRNTHNPNGNTIYGVSFCVSRKATGMKVGTRLMLAVEDIFADTTNVVGGIIGSRVPGFAIAASQGIQIDQYVWATRPDGKPVDDLLRFYAGCRYKLEKVMPDYIQDPASLNFGVLMSYPNPNYRV